MKVILAIVALTFFVHCTKKELLPSQGGAGDQGSSGLPGTNGNTGEAGAQGPGGETAPPTLPSNVVLLGPNGSLPAVDGSFLSNTGTSFNARLSLSSTDPTVMSDVTGNSVYLHAYRGNRILLFDNLAWKPVFINDPLSVIVPNSPNQNFDIFIQASGGSPQLEVSQWSGNSRTVPLAFFQGVLVAQNNPSKLYLGTGRTTVSGLCEDSEKKRFLWNYYNRIPKKLKVDGPAGYWNSGTLPNWRPINGQEVRVEIVVGWGDTSLELHASELTSVADPLCRALGIGEDSSTTSNADISGYAGVAGWVQMKGMLRRAPSPGYHYYQGVEISCTSATSITWSGFALVGTIQ